MATFLLLLVKVVRLTGIFFCNNFYGAVVWGVIVLVAVVRWYVSSKEVEMRNVYMMVDRILGMYIPRGPGPCYASEVV